MKNFIWSEPQKKRLRNARIAKPFFFIMICKESVDVKKNINTLELSIANILDNSDFKKMKKTWYCYTDETVLLIDLQKSNFGEIYYINLGVMVRSICDSKNPKIQDCHISIRLTPSISGCQEIEKVLDTENTSITDQARDRILRDILTTSAIPLLHQLDNKEKIKKSLINDELREYAVRSIVRNLINEDDT